jgi:high-affinity iron transporter
VAAAAGLCVGVAVVLRAIDESLPLAQREGFEAVLAWVAVGGITYMIVWMRRHSRELKGSLERSAGHALAQGSTMALVGMAFLAVLREGLETAVFLLATFQNSTNPVATGAGAVLGIGVAVGLGLAIFRGGVRINLSRFFRITGFVLAIVAAGLLALGVHAAQEAGWITALQSPAFDLTWLVAPGTVRASLLTGVLGLQPVPTVAEVLAWLLYAVPMGAYVLWPHRSTPAHRVPVASPAAS